MTAAERRKRELEALIGLGWQIVLHAKQRATVGPLEIFLCAGRWMNHATGERGKINRLSMVELIVRELSSEERERISRTRARR